MKKTITISVIVLVALGLGYYLFKISPQPVTPAGQSDFDLSGVKPLSAPREVDSHDYILGNRSAKNTLVAYEDFECPACAAIRPVLEQVTSTFKDTKVVYRHFPLYQIHPNAIAAAYAAESAGAQGKFWEMYDQLYESQNDWATLANPIDKFVELAKNAGVANLEQFKSDTEGKKYKDNIQADLVEANGLNVGGTPTLYFNGHLLQNGNLADLQKQAEPFYKN